MEGRKEERMARNREQDQASNRGHEFKRATRS